MFIYDDIAYRYDQTTKEYLGIEKLQKDPEESKSQETDIYLAVKNIAFMEPPICNQNEKQIWNGADWDIVKDFRGQAYFDIDNEGYLLGIETIKELGVDIAEKIKLIPNASFRKAKWNGEAWIEGESQVVLDEIFNNDIINQIESLEKKQHRAIREKTIYLSEIEQQEALTRLNDIDTQISNLRSQLRT